MTKPTEVPVRGLGKKERAKLDQTRRMNAGGCGFCGKARAIGSRVAKVFKR